MVGLSPDVGVGAGLDGERSRVSIASCHFEYGTTAKYVWVCFVREGFAGMGCVYV